jgi:hypothetical protein
MPRIMKDPRVRVATALTRVRRQHLAVPLHLEEVRVALSNMLTMCSSLDLLHTLQRRLDHSCPRVLQNRFELPSNMLTTRDEDG